MLDEVLYKDKLDALKDFAKKKGYIPLSKITEIMENPNDELLDEVVEYLEGRTSKEEMIDKIKQETRRYAKRQLTWFRKNKQTVWLDAQDKIQNNINIILEGLN